MTASAPSARDPGLPAHLPNRHAHLGLLQNRHHLLQGKTLSSHGKSPFSTSRILPEANSQSAQENGGPLRNVWEDMRRMRSSDSCANGVSNILKDSTSKASTHREQEERQLSWPETISEQR